MSSPVERCAECDTLLGEGQDRETTPGGVFCRHCFANLTAQLRQVVAAQGADIPYSRALLGGLGGAVIGVVVWWGFTVLTHIAFGLIAVVIGITVAKGITLLAGGKRHRHLQVMSVTIAAAAFFYATYLVNRTHLLRAFAESGNAMVLPLLPGPDMFVRVVAANAGIMDLVFLGIVVYEAWRITAPLKLGS